MVEDRFVGSNAELAFKVKKKDLATALGSGDVPVLATPRMIAWLEAATVAAVAAQLDNGTTTVGTAVEVDHVAASLPGSTVTVSATVRSVDGKMLIFDCEAVSDGPDGTRQMIGQGSITRAIVDREKFLARLAR
jgi:predicted thioesterase